MRSLIHEWKRDHATERHELVATLRADVDQVRCKAEKIT